MFLVNINCELSILKPYHQLLHWQQWINMTTLLGRMGEFDQNIKTWQQYSERFGNFLDANDVTDAGKKHSVSLSVVGPVTYTLLTSLISPQTPGDKSYDELITLLKNHFNAALSEIVQRFKFHSRSRQPEETIAIFVAELRSIGQHCNFGESLNDLLRDRN